MEQAAGLDRLETYGAFDERVQRAKRELLKFLIAAKEEGRSVVGYGAPAKGNRRGPAGRSSPSWRRAGQGEVVGAEPAGGSVPG